MAKPIEDNHFSYQTNGIGKGHGFRIKYAFYNMVKRPRHVVYFGIILQREMGRKEEAYPSWFETSYGNRKAYWLAIMRLWEKMQPERNIILKGENTGVANIR